MSRVELSRVVCRVKLGCSVEGRVALCRKFGRGCLDGALGGSEEIAGFSGEVVLVKRLTYGVKCIGYPLSGFRNDSPFSSVSQHVSSISTSCGNGGIFSI